MYVIFDFNIKIYHVRRIYRWSSWGKHPSTARSIVVRPSYIVVLTHWIMCFLEWDILIKNLKRCEINNWKLKSIITTSSFVLSTRITKVSVLHYRWLSVGFNSSRDRWHLVAGQMLNRSFFVFVSFLFLFVLLFLPFQHFCVKIFQYLRNSTSY